MAAGPKCHHLVIVGAVLIVLTILQWSRVQIYTDDGTLLLHTKHSKLHQVPVCNNDERLDYLQNKCHGNTGQIQILTLKEQRKSYAHIFVDEKHKIVACLPPKSGCTTWKAIMANNSQDKPLPPNFNTDLLHTTFLRKTLITMYTSFIRPGLEYASIVFCNCTETEDDILESVQKRAFKIITDHIVRTPTNYLYNEMGWKL